MRQLLVLLLLTGCAIGQQTNAPAIDAELYGQGTDGAAKISSIINNPGPLGLGPSLCPNTGSSIGCTIDARGMTGSDLVFHSNPFHGNNVPVTLLLGAHTYVACVPWVTGQSGYTTIGMHAPASVPGATRIRPGTAAGDGCPSDFPGSPCTSCLTFPYQHGPYLPGTYAALYNACGIPSSDTPVGTADCFGARLESVQLDCSSNDASPISTPFTGGNPTAGIPGCNFGYYTAASEERSGLFDVSVKNVSTACGFWDRSAQIGPSYTGGGSGPVHFSIVDTTCTPNTSSDETVDGWVWEMNPISIAFSGPTMSCTAPTSPNNPTASGAPTAYVIATLGSLSGITLNNTPSSNGMITNMGNCTPLPNACVVNTMNSATPVGFTAASCAITATSGGQVTQIKVGVATPGSGYPVAAIPGGGPLILRSTITGSGISNRLRYAIWGEGDRDADIQHIHTERVGDTGPCSPLPLANTNLVKPDCGATILHGFGTAPYSGGAFIAVNTTSGQGPCVHQGVGALSTDYFMADITREISTTGCVIVDDNILSSSGSPFTLAISDTPSHRRVAMYTGGQLFSRENVVAPTIAASGCGGAAATISNNNGNGAFTVDVGTTPTSACTITLPQATTGWNCQATDIAPTSTTIFVQKQSGGTATTAVITNYGDIATAQNYGAHDTLQVNCKPR